MRIVLKFGGSSLADDQRIIAAAERIETCWRQGNQVVAVVSAQGKTTDRLMAQAKKLANVPPLRELDALLGTGEQRTAALVAIALQGRNCPGISLHPWQMGLKTEGDFGDARVVGLVNSRIEQELERGKIVVVPGFQGLRDGGELTTLGRGGSDTTAVALAAFLNADICRIYTDVDGVYDRDPGKFSDAVKLEFLSYEQMLTMARRGAQVLHDRSVELAMQYRIPVHVVSAFCDGVGTWVVDKNTLK